MNILVKFKNMLVEALKDNKKLIIGLYAAFIIMFVAVWVLSADRMQSLATGVQLSANAPAMGGGDALDIFIHNEVGGIETYIGSIFFGIMAIVTLAYNAFNLGAIGQLFNTAMPNGAIKYICYLIPHGIFEITATVLQSAAGIMLFLFIWRFIKAWRSDQTEGASDAFEKTKKVLIQSIILMIFSTILLLIAAPIETFLSIPFSELIVGY